MYFKRKLVSMNSLKIVKTKRSPEVILDPDNNIFIISGNSYLEDSLAFFGPILDWFDMFYNELTRKNSAKTIELCFDFHYFNSSTIKFVVQIIKKAKLMNDIGINASIVWQYEEDDDDIKNAGIDIFATCKVNIPFELKPKKV